MRTVRTKVYKFNELSRAAQQKAISELWDINVNLDFVTEDADNIGLNLTEWEQDSASFFYNVRGEFISSAGEVVENILREHGQDCGTYKLAMRYKTAFQLTSDETDEELLSEREDLFLRGLLKEYKDILQNTFDDQTSEYQIICTIQGNEYEFTKDGKLFHK